MTFCGFKFMGDRPVTVLYSTAVKQRLSGARLTIDDMLGRYGLLVGLVAYFIGFWRYEVYELCATVNHKLPSVVRHSNVRERFFNHLVDSCSRNGEVVVVSRGRSHCGRHMIATWRIKCYGTWLTGEKLQGNSYHPFRLNELLYTARVNTRRRFIQVSQFANLLCE